MALGTAAALSVVDPFLRLWFEPLSRYLIYYVMAKPISDAIYYLLSPRRQVWLYPEDYVLNEMFTLFMYAFPLMVGQRYMLLAMVVPYQPVVAFLDSWLPLLLLCLNARWRQEETDDRSYRPGRRLERGR